MSHSDASEQRQELASCSEAKYSSSCDLNRHARSDLKHQSACDVAYQSTSEIAAQSSCGADSTSPSDSKYQCPTDTIYQSVYVMSDQKDECIIATEVSTHTHTHTWVNPVRIDLSGLCRSILNFDFCSLSLSTGVMLVWIR